MLCQLGNWLRNCTQKSMWVWKGIICGGIIKECCDSIDTAVGSTHRLLHAKDICLISTLIWFYTLETRSSSIQMD